MNTICEISDTNSIIVGFLVVLALSIAFFLIIRAIVLWYWKIDVIVKNLEEQNTSLKSLYEKQNHMHARINYYKFKELGDNKQAYENLLYMLLHDITFPDLKPEPRKVNYDALKEQYTSFFQSLAMNSRHILRQ